MEQGNLQGWTEKTKTDTGGICGSGRKRLKIQGRTLQCWEVWQLIKKQLSWFLGGGCLKLKVTKFTKLPLSHIFIFFLQIASFNPNIPVPHSIPFLREIQAATLCRHFLRKEAVEKLLREVMSLPIHVRQPHLIKRTAVGRKNKWDYQV